MRSFFTFPVDVNERTSPRLKDSLFSEQDRKWSGGTCSPAPDSIGNRLYDLDRIRDGTFKKDQDEGWPSISRATTAKSKTSALRAKLQRIDIRLISRNRTSPIPNLNSSDRSNYELRPPISIYIKSTIYIIQLRFINNYLKRGIKRIESESDRRDLRERFVYN